MVVARGALPLRQRATVEPSKSEMTKPLSPLAILLSHLAPQRRYLTKL
jgi:hypothetical protein